MNINPFIELISSILSIYSYILILSIIVSILISFEIINKYSMFVIRMSRFLYSATEPVLRPIRRILPAIEGIDISPLIVFLLIEFIKNFLYTYFYIYQ